MVNKDEYMRLQATASFQTFVVKKLHTDICLCNITRGTSMNFLFKV